MRAGDAEGGCDGGASSYQKLVEAFFHKLHIAAVSGTHTHTDWKPISQAAIPENQD